MSGDEEDEALTWAGGRDPSHYETPESKVPKAPRPTKAQRAAASTASTTTDNGADDEGAEDDEERAPMSSIVLVCLGILGGIYALYTVGWFVSWTRLSYTPTDVLELAAFQIQQVLAIVAAPLWFIVTLYFTRQRKATVRLLWLVIGALALVPWSFTLGR